MSSPSVVSISRVGPTELTDAQVVQFQVTFDQAVWHVGTEAFSVTTSDTITGASVTGVTSTTGTDGATSYIVTVDTGVGSGDLRLDCTGGDIINVASESMMFGGRVDTAALPYNDPQQICVADLDNDGLDDVLVLSDKGSAYPYALINQGDGTFTVETHLLDVSSLKAAVVADFNGDGRADIACIDYTWGGSPWQGFTGQLYVWTGKSDGSFGDRTLYDVVMGAQMPTVVDVDGDGRLDIVSAGNWAGAITVSYNTGTDPTTGAATFTQQQLWTGPVLAWSSAFAAAVGDLDGDGKTDIVTTDPIQHRISVLYGTGSGTFAAPIQITTGIALHPTAVQLADVDGDGRLDIVTTDTATVSNPMGVLGTGIAYYEAMQAEAYKVGTPGIQVVHNDGGRTFTAETEILTSSMGTTLAVADFDGDGVLDYLTLEPDDGKVLVTSSATGVGTEVTIGGSVISLATGNLDAGTLPDIAVGTTTGGWPPIGNIATLTHTDYTAGESYLVDEAIPTLTIDAHPGPTNQSTQIVSGKVANPVAGETVVITGGAAEVTTAVATDGTWSASVDIYGEGVHTLTATVTDPLGISSSATTSYTLDQTAPIVGFFSAGQATNQPVQTVTGIASDTEAGRTVSIYEGAKTVGTATVGADGSWAAQVTLAGQGSHTLSAAVTDAAGNTGTSASTITYTLDMTVPTVGFLNDPLTNRANDVLIGVGEPGSQVDIYQDGVFYQTVTADVSLGLWGVELALSGDGEHVITAVDRDNGGNSATGTFTLTLDTTPPAITIVNAGGTTNDPTQTITGTVGAVDAGVTVTIWDGATAIGTAVAGSDGSWSADVTLTGAGSHSLVATAEDALGNLGASAKVTYVINSTPAYHAIADTGGDTGAVALVSTAQDGTVSDNWCFTPVYSPDGTKIAFASAATDLVPGAAAGSVSIWVKDLATGTVELVSSSAAGEQANGTSEAPKFSADGTKIAFVSSADNLVADDKNDCRDLFVKDLATGTVTRVSVAADGTEADSDTTGFAFSPDGTRIAFCSAATNLGTTASDPDFAIWIKDLGTGAVTRVAAHGENPVWSPDGTRIAFSSYASDLVAGDGNGTSDVFVLTLATGEITRVSTDGLGGESDGDSRSVVFSPDGAKIAFVSTADDLVAGDGNGVADVFVKDLTTGAVTRVSTDAGGNGGNDASSDPVFSADGGSVLFTSSASDLVSGDSNGVGDVFVKNLATGAIEIVSATTGGAASDGDSFSVAVSSDGEHVAFVSMAGDLATGATAGTGQVYVKTLAGTAATTPALNATVADTGSGADTTVSGRFYFTDADVGDAHTLLVTPNAGSHGTLTATIVTDSTGGVTGEVGWTYTVTHAELAGLAAGSTEHEIFSVTIDDGTGAVLTETVDVAVQAVCFCAGTLIATPTGDRAVEDLAAGDLVLTHDGGVAPIRWLGRQTVSTRFADPLRVLPIRIRAGALGDGLPRRDLLVSPDHALLIDDVLVHAGALVDGTTIVRERDVPEVFVYRHVELADHALILAEGVPAETFIDNVDRLAFDNWAEHEALGDVAPLVEMNRPRAKSARQVPHQIRRRLAARAAGAADRAA